MGVGVGWGGMLTYMRHALQKRCALQDAVFRISENSKASQTDGNAMLKEPVEEVCS